jgi:DNA excision repair protein ERCC-3
LINPENPIIVQSDKSILLEVDSEQYEVARDMLAPFAELEKSPEHIHTYRLTPLSLWNAAAAGLTTDKILHNLEKHSKYDLPGNVIHDIRDYMERYGKLKLIREENDDLFLIGDDEALIAEVAGHKKMEQFIIERVNATKLRVNAAMRGHIKHALVHIGYPAEDLAGYIEGEHLPINLRSITRNESRPFELRHYQHEAADVFYAGGALHGGSGTIVLPCGAGKTMVGMAAMDRLQCSTLILAPSTVAVRQWIAELVDKTDLTEDQIGEYSGQQKEIKDVTVCTYQVMTHRKQGSSKTKVPRIEDYPHFEVFKAREWGLIIYDEVHLLPAPIFRITAELQACRRLGLTATLVREDNLEGDVFSLIGPKKYDVPWKDLERQGWIASAECYEIRIALPIEQKMEYAMTPQRLKHSYAAQNLAKLPVLKKLVTQHHDDHILVIGTYLDQLDIIASQLNAPLLTGKTSIRKREKLYEQFRNGEIRCLVVSKVANFSVDLPDANVAIEVSGTFGSRQEEAQRLGRILRPKSDGSTAHFYSLVTRDTLDQSYAVNRQRFLTEQGYRYEIMYDNDVMHEA